MVFIQIFKKNLLILLILFVMGFFVIVLSNGLYKADAYETISNNLYKNDTLHFEQLGSVSLEDLINISDDTFISKELSDTMRGIYFSSEYNYHLPILKGRFFNSKDFKAENNYVVIGKALQDYVYTKDNKSFYTLNNIEYQVIGVLGVDEDVESSLDYFVLFNLVNIYDYTPIGTRISIASNDDKIVDRISVLNLSENFYRIDIPNAGISRIWRSSNIYIITLICVFMCFIITLLFVMLAKNSYYEKYIKIFTILGFAKKHIYKEILLKEISLYVITFILGQLLAVLLYKEYFLNVNMITNVQFISLITCICFCICTYVLFTIQYNKINILVQVGKCW